MTDRPSRFLAWAQDMFGDIVLSLRERVLRFIEEAIELAHALGLPLITVNAIATRVYSRERGDPVKEAGQTQCCLEALGEALGINVGQYGTAGDKYSFKFLPTGIGTFVTVTCSCGAEKDLSFSEDF